MNLTWQKSKEILEFLANKIGVYGITIADKLDGLALCYTTSDGFYARWFLFHGDTHIYSLEHLDTLLSYDVALEIILYYAKTYDIIASTGKLAGEKIISGEKIILRKGTILEHILLEMDLESCVR